MSLFFGKRGARAKPQFTGLATQTSASSVPIPLNYGKNRGSNNILWQGDFTSHKQKQSGKGGGKGVTSYTYSASFILGLCYGPIVNITKVWKNDSTEDSYASMGFSLFTGTNPQAPWGYLTSAHPTEALGYPTIAYLAVANYDLGQTNTLGQHSFEMETLLVNTGVGGTVSDADPALMVQDFLANDTHGVGFDLDILENLESTGAAPTTGDGAFQTYCQAMGFALSPFMSSQSRAGEILQRWADLCNTALVWTGYSLKFHPWGSDEITANGVTYIPNFPVRYTLTDSDYIYSAGADPITFDRTDPSDAFNSFSLIIANKNNEYNDLPVPWRDQGLIDQYGLKNQDSMDAKEVTDPGMAAIMVTFMGQREAYIRNTFQFTLPVRFCRLEPMDVLYNYDPRFGWFYTIIREVNENDEDQLDIIAEEYPASISTNVSTTPQPTSNTPINTNVSPGPVNVPVIFEPPATLTGGVAQVWAGVSGGDGTNDSPNWGGCFVWLSTDDITFNQIGDIEVAARQGKLTATLNSYGGANPDTGNTLSVNLAMSGGELEDAASAFDAETGVTISYVDGELLSYLNVTLTGTNAYDIDDLWRGQHGTTAGSHTSGADFLRLDDAVFKYDIPAAYIGETIYLKFQSYNIFGGGIEDISTVTSYPFTISGSGFGTGSGGVPAVPTGFALSAGSGFTRLTWNANSANDNVTGYQILRATGLSQPIGSATVVGTAPADATEYNDASVAGGDYTYFLKAINAIGTSGGTAGLNATVTGSGGGSSLVPIDDATPPASPDAGQLWWHSGQGRLKIYYDDGTTAQWVDATPTPLPIPTEPVVRASRVANGTGSVSFTWPTGTQEGDLVILFCSSAWGVNTPAGWTTLQQEDGANINGEVMSKVMSSADITAGSVTVTFAGSYGELVIGVSLEGAPTIRNSSHVRNIANGGTLSTPSSSQAGDLTLWFVGLRDGSATPTFNRGTSLASRGTAPYGQLYEEALSTGGVVSAIVTHNGSAFAAQVTLAG